MTHLEPGSGDEPSMAIAPAATRDGRAPTLRAPESPADAFAIRSGTADDGPALQAIERATHEQFRDIGVLEVADDEPDPVELLAEFALSNRSWVAIDPRGKPIGYILVEVVDRNGHIAQVSVDPEMQGRGVGRALVDRAKEWATADRRAAITLTTYAEVPWNAPLYEHLGFRVLDAAEIGPELRAVQEEEARQGFGPAGRVAMGLDLGREPAPDRGGSTPALASGA